MNVGRHPKTILGLLAIALIALTLRLVGLHWDSHRDQRSGSVVLEPTHLHPDERFLTMVTVALDWPGSWAEYLDATTSPLNPHNRGFGFFPYGTLPVFAVKAIGSWAGWGGYDTVHLVGRALSAILDTTTLLLLFGLARELYGRRIAMLAALLYALTALAIQQAHFYTVDSWVTALSLAAVYLLVRFQRRGLPRDIVGFGLTFGAAMASKPSVFLLAALAAFVVWKRAYLHGEQPATSVSPRVQRLTAFAGPLALAALVSLLVFRVAQPYAFSGNSIFDFSPNPAWLEDLREARELVTGQRDLPPGHQWTERAPLVFPWTNMVLWGLGPALGLAAWAGWFAVGWRRWRGRPAAVGDLVPWLWVAIVFFHQGAQWVKSLRYFLPIYPLLALFAAWLLATVWTWARQRAPMVWPRVVAGALAVTVVGGTALWALAFTSIYRRPHSRIAASQWIYANLPPGTVIANEHWDDGLPLRLEGRDGFRIYEGLELPLYAEDTPEKLATLVEQLERAEYLVLSSNRLIDSIPRLPMRYPMTTRYYEALVSGDLGFELAAEFTSYPRLFGFEIPDQGAEEAFSVYDHPRVRIFRKTANWDASRATARLGAVDWDEIQKLWPRHVPAYKGGLELEESRRERMESGPSWTEQFPAESEPAGLRITRWVAALAWCALLGFPLLFVATRSFPDGGWLLARPLGLLLVGTLHWWWGVVGTLPSGWLSGALAAGATSALVAPLAWRRRGEIAALLRQRGRLLAAEEGLFWAAFAAMLLVRWQLPDLWHPARGGEKPMDLAMLTAVVRSDAFPPYDPWFAGGTLNYYYFGFALAAPLVKLTGIAPAAAYNLMIATLFACAVAGAFTASGALGTLRNAAGGARGSRTWFVRGLFGVGFVLLAGNLGEARLALGWLLDRVPDWPHHWWYWNASRVVAAASGETAPITEFPAFTFLFADLHAHLMALPLGLLALGLAIAQVGARRETSRRLAPDRPEAVRLGLIALALGALWATNTWDAPTYAIVVGAFLLLAEWPDRAREWRTAALRTAVRALTVAVLALVLFAPFGRHFARAYGALDRWQGSTTSLADFLTAHGLFLFVAVSAVVAFARRHLPSMRPGPWSLTAIGAGAALLVLEGLGARVLCLSLLVASIVVAWRAAGSDQPTATRAWSILVAAGAGLALAVEFAVVRGDIGRMNTVFKTYFQIWVLWGLAAAYLLPALWTRTGARRTSSFAWRAWRASLVVLALAAALYPVLAIPARTADRWSPETPRRTGLDGDTFLAEEEWHGLQTRIPLAADAAAIAWLRREVAGTPVVLEASLPPYQWGSRISIHTGLPTVIGWDWHQRQQRATQAGDPVGRRLDHVARIYQANDCASVRPLLDRYRIRFVVLGEIERRRYGPDGMAKFDRSEEGCFALAMQGETNIYRVTSRAEAESSREPLRSVGR